MWPHRSPDLNPCDCILWGTLKDRAYGNSPHALQELEESIGREMTSCFKTGVFWC
jgi:hypothetical protein